MLNNLLLLEYYLYLAGGSSGEVCLYDLRFVSDSNPKIIQRYLPSALNKKHVSVSGIDISRDNKELLISYENDQVRFIFIAL